MDEIAFGQNTSNSSDKDVVLGHAESRRRKRKINWKILVFIAIAAMVVGLIIWIIISNQDSENEMNDITIDELSDNITYYANGDKNETIDYLNSLDSEKTDGAAVADACAQSSYEYMNTNDLDRAASILSSCLESKYAQFTDWEKYFLMIQLLNIYRETNNKESARNLIRKMIMLPDDMVIMGEDWREVKNLLKKELEEYEND